MYFVLHIVSASVDHFNSCGNSRILPISLFHYHVTLEAEVPIHCPHEPIEFIPSGFVPVQMHFEF